MEAKAKHDFTQTADDELGFKKGDILKIINQIDDANWYKAELKGKTGYVPKNYIEMEKCDWLVKDGCVKREQSESMLLEKKADGSYKHHDGAFLVRHSESSPGEFSLSVKYGDAVQHFKILTDGLGKYFLWIQKFDSINALIKHHKTSSVSRSQQIMLKDMTSDWNDTQQQVQRPRLLVRGLYDFVPQEDSELGFSKGDTIEVIDQSDTNWWVGRRGQKEGQFPRTYVARIS